jgi:hypothetical protein
MELVTRSYEKPCASWIYGATLHYILSEEKHILQKGSVDGIFI